MSDVIAAEDAIREFMRPLINACSGLDVDDYPASYLYLVYGPAFDAEQTQNIWADIKHRETFESFEDMQTAQFLSNRAYYCMRDEKRWQEAERLLQRVQTTLNLKTGRKDMVHFERLLRAIQSSDGHMSWLLTYVSIFARLGSEVCSTAGMENVSLGTIRSDVYEFLQDVIELYLDVHAFAARLDAMVVS